MLKCVISAHRPACTEPLQLHDYNTTPFGTKVSSNVKVQWLDAPGLYPADIIARHVMLNCQKRSPEPIATRSFGEPDTAAMEAVSEEHEYVQRTN